MVDNPNSIDGPHSTQLDFNAEHDDFEPNPPSEAKRGTFGQHHVGIALAHLPLYSWAWSLMPLATLGLSTLLSAQRSLHDFPGLYTIGLIVYFFGLLQYVSMLLAKIIHFTVIRHSFAESFKSPEEIMLHASFWMGFWSLIVGAIDFSSPNPGSRLSETFFAVFWIYFVCAQVVSLSLYLALFQGKRLEAGNMTPAWLLPVLPVILVGVLAGTLAESLHPAQRYAVLLCGVYSSGSGFLLALPTYAIYFWRLFTAGIPEADTRPGMMIAVGPLSFAPLAFLKMSASIPRHYGFFAANHLAEQILQTLALFLSIAIFGMGAFLFLIAFCSIVRTGRRMTFHLTWYGLVFPNVGFLSTMGLLGVQIPSDGVIWVASVGTAILSLVWICVTGSHIRALILKNPNLW